MNDISRIENSLYLPSNGYLDMRMIMSNEYTFNFVVSARGLGKTYGALLYLLETGEKFILVRRSEDEMILCAGSETNPFNEVATDHGYNVEIKPLNKHMYGVYVNEEKTPQGLIVALTTFQKFRGMNFLSTRYIVYDEFIPQENVKRLKGEGEAVLQMYETVNRNRELKGEMPVKLVCMANSLNINNDTLVAFGVVDILQRMKKMKREAYIDNYTDMLVIRPAKSPISKKKSETALYKIRNAKYNKMALNNDFADYYEKNIRSLSLSDFTWKMSFDNMNFYKHKSERKWYVTETRKGMVSANDTYNDTDFERTAFKKKYYHLYNSYMNGRIVFEVASLEVCFINLFKI